MDERTVTLQARVAELTAQHGSLRAAARAIQVEPGYLSRLGNGERVRPGKDILRRMGLCAVLIYVRKAASIGSEISKWQKPPSEP